jgi:hypothetical protein
MFSHFHHKNHLFAKTSTVTHFSCLIQHWLLFKAMIYVIGWNMLTMFRHFTHKNHLHVAFVGKKQEELISLVKINT